MVRDGKKERKLIDKIDRNSNKKKRENNYRFCAHALTYLVPTSIATTSQPARHKSSNSSLSEKEEQAAAAAQQLASWCTFRIGPAAVAPMLRERSCVEETNPVCVRSEYQLVGLCRKLIP